MRTKRRPAWRWMVLGPALLAAAACSDSGGEERQNPFATGNVSVAPQVEGREPAPTPLPAPRPPDDPVPESP